MNNLRSVLGNLKSDKVKDRQEGLASIRTVFANDRVVANFHVNREGEGDPRAWLSVFQALFGTVLQERATYLKKGTAVAQARLGEAASVVRWLTERTAHLMNKRVVKALFEHLLQTMLHNGELVVPVALDYVKALRSLVNYTPHLEHMEDETWVKMVEMSFNIVLGDHPKTSFDDDTSPEASPAPLSDFNDADIYMDNTRDEMDEHELPTPTSSKKRRRGDKNITSKPSSKPNSRKLKRARYSSVTLEQIEFSALLSTLLRAPSVPLLSKEYPHMASAVLHRLQRFLDLYPGESSLLHDYLMILSSILRTLSLNKKTDVEKFAQESWDGLVGLWGTKNKNMKESLVIVLRILFPFTVLETNSAQTKSVLFDCAEGIGRLWQLLDSEAESRWGMDCLSLDSLRLEMTSHNRDQRSGPNEAFEAKAFRAGWNFDANQALIWAILELQADCAGKLFQLSESMHSSSTLAPAQGERRRGKLENPVVTLVHAIQTQPAAHVRKYRLQVLLFFVERHWNILHTSLQQDIVNTLLQFVSFDDGVIQSWVFLNLATIAYIEGSKPAVQSTDAPSKVQTSVLDTVIWDSIWTHAVRRANIPIVCRAACHTAYALIAGPIAHKSTSARYLPTSQKVLAEIEALVKDMDVQGPAFPYDSVCVFLTQCLRIASQDVRLYRMQLEEKILSWLVDNWRVVGVDNSKMSLHAVKDVTMLLESICSLGSRSLLESRVLLPTCQTVDYMIEEGRTRVIQDFLLDAQLPPFCTAACGNELRCQSSPDDGSGNLPGHLEAQLVQPRGRERKISAFFLKSTDALLREWDLVKENNLNVNAESARRSLDMAVIALAFESILVVNGTSPNRRVVQNASKLISATTSLLRDARWTLTEQALVSLGLEPLFTYGTRSDNYYWEALLPPEPGSGIRSQTLKTLMANNGQGVESQGARVNFLQIIWRNADIEYVWNELKNTLRDVLRILLGEQSSHLSGQQGMDIDDRDGFGPIRTANLNQQSTESNRGIEDAKSMRTVMEVCIKFLTVGPSLQSMSGTPTRDNLLSDLVLGCADTHPEKFFLVCPLILNEGRRRSFSITIHYLDSLLDAFGVLLQSYAHSRSELLQLLAIQLLDATLELWTSATATSSEVVEKARQLIAWLSTALKKEKIRVWTTRDAMACFLDRYLAQDPTQSAWSVSGDDEDGEQRIECMPMSLLPFLGADEDIRIRFRVAVANARLFAIGRQTKFPALEIYNNIKYWYTKELDNYEHMLTRMLTLGNIMVVSSAVRRGPYWHLLETCLHSPSYSRHVEAILSGVSQRLGLTSFSALFEAYGSQLAYSIRQSGADFLRFPPHLLGYRDRKQCVEATFRAFTPTDVLTGAIQAFEGHCRVLQKSLIDGIRDCFGEIIGIQVVTWFDEMPNGSHQELEKLLQKRTFEEDQFEDALRQHLDGVIIAMLRTLGDQDYSNGGAILDALQQADPTGRGTQTFQALSKYRHLDLFETHQPNLPAFPAQSVLRGLTWIQSRLPDVVTKATTYHILHELLAELHQSPFVNEQIRLVNAMSLWIAHQNRHFEDDTLLYTLVHGMTSCLAQSDLARSAQSILEWVFRYYRKIKTNDVRIPNILVRISSLAHGYATALGDDMISQMGIDLKRWVDEQVLMLSKGSTLLDLVLKALPAWPYEPSEGLNDLYVGVSTEALTSVLNDQKMKSNKFRLVRRLRDKALSCGYDDAQFAKKDFWRLRESIPPINQLQNDDVSAFATLIYLNHGRISSFGDDHASSVTIRNRHRGDNNKPGLPVLGGLPSARDCIIAALLSMLEDDDCTNVYIAYTTLRFILSTMPEDITHFTAWSSDLRVELHYLQTYRRLPVSRPPPNLAELLSSDVYLDSAKDFSTWISSITTLLSDVLSTEDLVFAQLKSVLLSDIYFAEQVLPILVHTLLVLDTSINSTDGSYRSLLSRYFTAILSSDQASLNCLRSIVDTILHLRHFSPRSEDALAYNKWLDIDFTLLAEKSIVYGAYTTALLFLELASEDRIDTSQSSSTEGVLYEIYAHIDEPDGFYGIQTKNLQDFLIKRFHHENQWEKALRFHGAALEAGSSQGGDADGLLKSFHSFGFDHLAIDTLQNMRGQSGFFEDSSGMTYRLGWRTETWDLPERHERSPGTSLYQSLRAIYRERDPDLVEGIVRKAINAETRYMSTLGSENVAEIRAVAQDLMCLNEILQWRQAPIQMQLTSKQVNLDQWKEFFSIDSGFDFSDLESIMATRISLVRSARQREERQQIGNLATQFTRGLIDIEKRALLRLSKAAREAGRVQIALTSVIKAQRLEPRPSFDTSQEFSDVLWLQREEKLAIQFLRSLADSNNSSVPGSSSLAPRYKALLMSKLGAWTAEAFLEKPSDILNKYFDPSISMLSEIGESDADNKVHATVYRASAIFAERQYHAILRSPDAIRWKVYVDRKTQEIQHRSMEISQMRLSMVNTSENEKKELKNKTEQLWKDLNRAQKVLQEDSELSRKHDTARVAFLRQTIEMHSRSLEASDDFDDDAAIRFCSLWFANFDDNDAIQETVRVALNRIPSRKLVFLAHQITARISKSTAFQLPKNQENLQHLVIRMCKEHPFHSIYQVYCLQPDRPTPTNRRQSSGQPSPATQTDRNVAASDIFERLRDLDDSGHRVRDIEKLCDACLEWAMHDIKSDPRFKNIKRERPPHKIPRNFRICSISNLKVPVSTSQTPLDLTMAYDDCVWISHYEQGFDTAGGVNLPKITTCVGDDGQKFKQLFKGNDDLRQDAVMEQVFDVVNKLLHRDRDTRRRELRIRGYKIIPLSSQGGMLEFVSNTHQLIGWLQKSHPRYRPGDMKPNEAQSRLSKLHEAFPRDIEKRFAAFLEVQKHLKPVMRHYFTEKHKISNLWFSMRLKYTRSVATASIVGHVLGIGDRHCSNILMDNQNGEVVHIDFGIAFDQGKLLPCPERVPFRLTGDVVDGMGISGTQGVFQRCAEETLRVLREGSDVIMTILEVFKHDPLHSWTASEFKVKQAQSDIPVANTANDTNRVPMGIGIDMSSGTAEEAADRALSSVMRKLDKSLSVECAVNELIAEATDINNLGTLYFGWASYL